MRTKGLVTFIMHANNILSALVCLLLIAVLYLLTTISKDSKARAAVNNDNVAEDKDMLPGFTRGHELRPAVVNGLPYRYTPPPSTGINLTGTDFIVDPDLIRRLGLPPEEYFDLSESNAKDFVFVTAGDDEHYLESKDCIGSIQKYFPGYKILYYDIGLKAEQRNDVSSWCNVIVRDFKFDDYPQHIQDKETKCFKFLIIQMALRYYGAVFWVDASFRAKAPIDEFDGYFDKAIQNGGVLLGRNKHSTLSNVGWTDPFMFQFLVSDTLKLRDVGQVESGAMLLYNTQFVFTQVLWWTYLCSLDARCCPPQHDPEWFDFGAQTKLEQQGVYHEHRHDQSAVNILAANLFGYRTKQYAVVQKRHTHLREASSEFVVNKC